MPFIRLVASRKSLKSYPIRIRYFTTTRHNLSPRIYTSPHPSIPSSALPRTSLASFLFPSPPDSSLSSLAPSSPHHDFTLPAFIDSSSSKTLTRSDVLEQATALARGLLQLSPQNDGNERPVAGLFLGNSLEWPVAFLGCQKAGMATALFGASSSPSELAHQIALSKPLIIFTSPSLLPTLLQAFSQTSTSLPPSESASNIVLIPSSDATSDLSSSMGYKTWTDIMLLDGNDAPRRTLDLESSSQVSDPDVSQRTSVICFSSGTEGLSKGVEITHYNLTSLCSFMRPPIMPTIEPGKDILLGILPFSHIYGLFKLILRPLQLGFPVVIVPKVDLKTICSAVETHKITCGIVVPPILLHLGSSKVIDKYDMSSLKWLLSGAAPLPLPVIKAVTDRFASNPLVLLEGSGLTEASPVTHILQLSDAPSHPGSIGRLIPNVSARLVDPDTELDLEWKEGVEGEMWVRGENVMKGYLNNPEANARTLTSDGWLKTGDIARVDAEGYWYIVDRRKELIKYNGFQVAPAELEGLLLTHEMVSDVGVIGVWSERDGSEVPRAYVVLKTDGPLSPVYEEEEVEKLSSEIVSWFSEKVASHKQLRGGIVFVDQIPKSPSGKILRRQLRDRAKAGL